MAIVQEFENVTVSPFASSSAGISPREDKDNQFEIVYMNTPYATTYSNIKRLLRYIKLILAST